MHPRHLGPGQNPARLAPALLGLVLFLALLPGCGVTSAVTNIIDSKDTGLRKRVAVAPFTSGVPSMKERATALQMAISQHLVKMGGVVVGDFTPVQEEMKKLPQAIAHPEDRAMEASRRLGVNALLAGNITDLSVQRALKGIYGMRENRPFLSLEVELRLVDVTTGIVIGQEAFKRQERVDDTVAEAIEGGAQPDDKLVNKLLAEITEETTAWVGKRVASLPWGGTVLEVEGNRVLVSVGRDTGLPPGSILTVYALGERIKAGTGQQLALPGPRVGRIKLGELGARFSWAEIVERASDEKKAKEAKEAKEAEAKKAKEAAEKKAKDGQDTEGKREAPAKEAQALKETMEEKPQPLTFEVGQWVRTH
ncbi:MAG: hypothetical protein HY910_08360 [Desulfarculus sp.]|nr:hypothetical protein [Desulfarculus sp.]